MTRLVRMQDYKQLDGSSKLQVSSVGAKILRRFDRTPFPTAPTDVVCPHFMLLAWANGCMFNCAWCYLKGTFRFYKQKPNGRIPQIYKSRAEMSKDIRAFLNAKVPPEIINTGELADSLMEEGSDGDVHQPFSEWIMSFFEGTPHKVLFLTKSLNINRFLSHDWQKNAILAWSINAPEVAKRWEHYAPAIAERLTAAQEVYEQGYEVRLRIDPMVPVEHWKEWYQGLVDAVFGIFDLEPSVITLGSLRGLTTTILYCKDKSWLPFLTEKSNWGKKPPFAQRLEMYQNVIETCKQYGFKSIGVCKETLAMWEALKKDYSKIKCNCVALRR